jgi:hypothetical protein
MPLAGLASRNRVARDWARPQATGEGNQHTSPREYRPAKVKAADGLTARERAGFEAGDWNAGVGRKQWNPQRGELAREGAADRAERQMRAARAAAERRRNGL